MDLKKIVLPALAIFALTGCTYKTVNTPVVMSYDGSNVDYSKVAGLKHAKVCKIITDKEGDTSVITAARKAGIKHVVHVDTSYEFDQFLFFTYNHRRCITVYGDNNLPNNYQADVTNTTDTNSTDSK